MRDKPTAAGFADTQDKLSFSRKKHKQAKEEEQQSEVDFWNMNKSVMQTARREVKHRRTNKNQYQGSAKEKETNRLLGSFLSS